MGKKSDISRLNYLSLNLKTIKNALDPDPQIKIIASRGDKYSPPINPHTINPWISSISSNLLLSRNKIGKVLLKRCRNGFHLDDPHMVKSRFFVDYHRMHDPALKHYFHSTPVRNRLKELDLVNQQNDAICSIREFVQYLQYLDGICAQNETNSEKIKKLEMLKKQEAEERLKSKKFKVDSKSKKDFNNYVRNRERKRQLLIAKKVQVIERAVRTKEENKNQIKLRNRIKEIEYQARKQVVIENEHKRKAQMTKMLQDKLARAEQRKQTLELQKKVLRKNQSWKLFEHSLEVNQLKHFENLELYQKYHDQRRRDVEARARYLRNLQEIKDAEMLKIRQQMTKRNLGQKFTDTLIVEFMKAIHKLAPKYQPSIESDGFEEISRRFAMLKLPFITNCVERTEKIFQILNIPKSIAILVQRIGDMIGMRVIVVPDINALECKFVIKRVAEIISQAIMDIKRTHLKRLRGLDNLRMSTKLSQRSEQSDGMKKIAFGDVKIEEIDTSSDTSSDTNIDSVTSEKDSTTKFNTYKVYKKGTGQADYYDLTRTVRNEVQDVFEIITKLEFYIPDKYQTREFIHLHEFQKYYLHQSLEFYLEFLEMKKEHDWANMDRSSWKNQNINLDEISEETARLALSYTRLSSQITECVRKISQYLCIEVKKELTHQQQ